MYLNLCTTKTWCYVGTVLLCKETQLNKLNQTKPSSQYMCCAGDSQTGAVACWGRKVIMEHRGSLGPQFLRSNCGYRNRRSVVVDRLHQWFSNILPLRPH
jgi:hypothetical protein